MSMDRGVGCGAFFLLFGSSVGNQNLCVAEAVKHKVQ